MGKVNIVFKTHSKAFGTVVNPPHIKDPEEYVRKVEEERARKKNHNHMQS